MNGGILPLMLICATVGLALASSPRRSAVIGLAAVTVAALLFTLVPLTSGALDVIFVGLWGSLIATAALSLVPDRFANRLIIPAALNAGGWAGALAGATDRRGDLLAALVLVLLFIPARWFTLHGRQIVIKVVASWMIAIASLAMFVSLMPTPGYKPDHME